MKPKTCLSACCSFWSACCTPQLPQSSQYMGANGYGRLISDPAEPLIDTTLEAAQPQRSTLPPRK